MRFIALFVGVFTGTVGAVMAEETVSLSARFEDDLQTLRQQTRLMAVGGIVMRDGEVIALAVDGQRRKGHPDTVTTDEIWHIGSITKSMTATMIARLVEEEVLSFDQTIAEMLPDIADEIEAGWRDVTIMQLLNHAAGAPANFPVTAQLVWPETSEELTKERRAQILKLLARPPKYAPGDQFLYSNVGYTLAGHIAESVTGLSYESLMQEYLFQPLSLETAGFGAPQGENAWGHAQRFGFTVAMDPKKNADNTPLIAPAGRVHLSLNDLAVYGQAHLDGLQGRGRLLLPETVTALHTPYLDNYAAGWIIVEQNLFEGKVHFHNGSNTMWYAILLIIPERETVMAFVTNDGKIMKAEKAFLDLARSLMETAPELEAIEAQ